MSFSDDAQVEWRLNEGDQTSAQIDVLVEEIVYNEGPSTNLAAALRVTRESIFVSSNGDRPDAPNIVIVLTDGNPNVDKEQTIPQAELLRDPDRNNVDDTLVICVGITTMVNFTILQDVASTPAGVGQGQPNPNVIEVDDFPQLNSRIGEILNAACPRECHDLGPVSL